MQIKIGPAIFDVAVSNESHVESKHTGQLLHTVDVGFSITGTEPAELLSIGGEQGVFSGEDWKTRWKIAGSSYSYTDGQRPIYRVSLTLEEQEDIRIEALTISGITLYPHEYQEDIDGEALIVTARAETPKDTAEQLFELMKNGSRYFSVLRTGVNDSPLTMRFGRCLWSEHDSSFKHSIVLVEEVYDNPEVGAERFKDLYQPAMGNTENVAVETALGLQALMNMLHDKGVLTDDDAVKVRSFIEENLWSKQHELFKVSDVDDWEK